MTSYLASFTAPPQSAGSGQYFQPSMWGIGLKANVWPIRIAQVETNFISTYPSFVGWNIISGPSLSISSAISSAPVIIVPLRLNSPPPNATGGACYWWEDAGGNLHEVGSSPTGVVTANYFYPPSIAPGGGTWQPPLALTIPVGSALWMGSFTTYAPPSDLKDAASASYCKIYYEELRVQWSS